MNFGNMKVAHRLAAAFGVVLVVMVLISLYSLNRLASIEGNLEQVVLDGNVKIKHNNDMRESLHVISRVMRSVILLTDKAEMQAELAKVQKAREGYTAAWDALQKMPPSEKGKALHAKIEAARNASLPLNSKVLELAMADQKSEAITLLFAQANPATLRVQDAIDENLALQEASNKTLFEDAQASYSAARTVLIVSDLFALALAVLVAWLVTRSITSQLGAEPGTAAELAHSVSQGDLSANIHLAPGDSTSLMAQLKGMQEHLSQVVAHVRDSSVSVASASSQIASGSQDLSERTERQAGALEETAASMDELNAAVNNNANGAQQANQLAQQASAVAIKGGEVVAQVVDTMKHINDSSKRVFEIISLIDSIAFQTNILALNAAVEAARAGDQGRGFAVVATEVRSLAGRAAEAAKSIKTLISASVTSVAQGCALVDQAGSTMAEVVSSIGRVTTIMGEISMANTDQSLNVAQVDEAVSQIDQITQQNAAMVEEMAAAAASLGAQAQELSAAMVVFKLPGDPATPAMSPKTTTVTRARPVSLPTAPRGLAVAA